ncbi:hypothetical protein SAMN05444161_8828 [Rhizobiales bacterium GAS191]|nr:hypothetical protein SAMN05444161_8828 [Rhizobiales bacterium GAS191]
MIDDPRKTDLLMAMLKESLPIPANIPPYLARELAKGTSDISILSRCNVIDVFYSGDMGGILCSLDIGGPDTKSAHVVSMTHLTFNRNVPLAREIEAYQRHRNKKLKKQQSAADLSSTWPFI